MAFLIERHDLNEVHEEQRDTEERRRAIRNGWIGCGMLFALVFLVGAYVVYRLFFLLGALPTGDLLSSHPSPKGTWTMHLYVANGGATVDYAVRGELENMRTHKTKTIYWAYREDHATVQWHDDNRVEINGRLLDVRHDRYDFRRQ